MEKLTINRYMGKPPLEALLDDDDYKRLSKHKFFVRSNGYIGSKKLGLLHRLIMNAPTGKVVDHINGNPLDNRKSNLRLCSIQENVRNCKLSKNNSSGVSGVSFRKQRNKYRAYIMVDRKQINLGHYSDVNLAIKARKNAEKKYFKEFAPTF